MRFLSFLHEMNKFTLWIKRLHRNDKEYVKGSAVRKRKKQGKAVNII